MSGANYHSRVCAHFLISEYFITAQYVSSAKIVLDTVQRLRKLLVSCVARDENC